MLVGVLSDTHRHIWAIDEAVAALKDCDMIIHLGDNVQDVKEISKYFKGKVIGVCGNCDFTTSVPNDRIETIEGKKIFITHGHRYDVKYDILKLKYKAQEIQADVVLYGHTHIARIDYEDGIWFINPGSPVLSRDGYNSVAVLEIKNGVINGSIRSL